MRAVAVLVGLLMVASIASAGAVYLDQSRVVSCLLAVQAAGANVFLNCEAFVRTVAASQPPGGVYRLTVDWSPAAQEWAQLHADLFSCNGACAPANTGVCINDICQGDPHGPDIVQQAATVSGSPLVLTIPTAGDETNVSLVLKPTGPVFASVTPQSIHVRLEALP